MSDTNRDPNFFTAEEKAEILSLPVDKNGNVNIHDFCHDWFHQQAQYLSREFVKPEVAEGMRLNSGDGNYHSAYVFREDLPEVIARIRKIYWALGRTTR